MRGGALASTPQPASQHDAKGVRHRRVGLSSKVIATGVFTLATVVPHQKGYALRKSMLKMRTLKHGEPKSKPNQLEPEAKP